MRTAGATAGVNKRRLLGEAELSPGISSGFSPPDHEALGASQARETECMARKKAVVEVFNIEHAFASDIRAQKGIEP